MLMNLKSIFVLIFILFFRGINYAQYTPFFQNYTLTEFNAGNQNWGISLTNNGKLYVANDKGLLEFDGLKWNLFQLPNKTIIRSVFAINDIIYTGSYEDFGYWKKNQKGELVYTSLVNLKEQEISLDEEFWQIQNYNDAILFRSFSNLYIYKNEKITKIKSESTIISSNVINNNVYVSTLKGGVYILDDEILVPFIRSDKLYNTKIVSIANLNNRLLITTALKGSYLYSNNKLENWKSPINQIIKEQQLNTFLELENGNMVFGTIKDGVYITNNLGKILFHISKENGLLNNTILSLGLGKNNKLWIGLDNGVALVDLNYHNILYNDNSGKLGAVYDIINYKNTLYIGSNTGLFYLEDDDFKLKFIENSQGQVWDLKEINGELFCGHNDGTFLIQNKKLNKISNSTGGWVIKKVPESNSIFIQGTYAGLVKYKYENGKWNTLHLKGTTIPIKYLVFEDSFTAWAAHAYKGLYKIKFDKDYKTVEVENYKKRGLWSDFNVRVYNIKNDICFKTNQGWQKYEALIDSIIPNTLLNKTLGEDASIISEADINLLVTKNKKDKISFVSLVNEKSNLELPNKNFKDKLVVDRENVSQLSDSIFFEVQQVMMPWQHRWCRINVLPILL